jgi:hypothetical protein
MTDLYWMYDDGGRADAGYKGGTGDCFVRAVAIATERPYREVYDLTNAIAKTEPRSKTRRGQSNARLGVHRWTADRVCAQLGLEWTPTMKIGSGTTVHVRADELPAGRLVLSLSRHYAAFVDGLLHDTYDVSREGTRAVYGYYRLAS